ncbi:hypothetical protein FF36_06039 [Frankia torreyi]|uniref:Uncharacterized protein n=1 Tax=Frankia torreyi TaxID=1856 RepID=A0A0D8B652_9ACTN|nr:hypothetical protein [Frankia torreyi]KJE19671.1 hypothetical protein FF36_06039 [Frankia torreyi]
MAATGPIEDILQTILGYTVGAADGGLNLATGPGDNNSPTQNTNTKRVADNLRPSTIGSAGGAPWLIPEEREEHYHTSGSWKPKFKQGAVTFWRWMSSDSMSNAEQLTVWVGKKDDSSSANRNSLTPAGAADSNPLMDVRAAWTAVFKDIPQIAGPRTPFDPATLRGVNVALQRVGEWAQAIFEDLDNDVSRLDTKVENFDGSAAAAFRDQVNAARRGVQGVLDQIKRWSDPLGQAVTSAVNFVNQLALDNAYWNGQNGQGETRGPIGGPPGVWPDPFALIVQMFDQSTVYSTYGTDPNYNHSGGLWETGRIRGELGEYEYDLWREMYIRFPDWSGVAGDFAVLRQPSWFDADRALRAAWAKKVQDSFAPSLGLAQDMMDKFAAAASAVKLTKMPPVQHTPHHSPDNANTQFNPEDLEKYLNGLNNNLNNGLNDLNNNLNSLNDGLNHDLNDLNNDLNKNLNGLNDNLNGLNNDLNKNLNGLNNDLNNNLNGLNDGLNKNLNGLGDGLNGLNKNLGNGLNGLGDGLNGLGNGLNGLGNDLGGGLNGLNDNLGNGLNGLGNGLNDLGGGLNGLNDNLGNGLNGLGNGLNDLGGGLNGLNDNLGNGLNGPGGDLSGVVGGPGALAGLNNPNGPNSVTGGGLNGLGDGQNLGGLNASGPQTLGDLSPQQLSTLQQAGQLDGVPLTPEQSAALERAGLGAPGAHTLGDLSPEQLQELQRDGLLNDVPLTSQNLQTLGDAGLLGATNGTPHTLGDLSPAQLAELGSSGALDNVPVTDAQLNQLRQDGLLGPNATGLHSLGDLSPAQLADLQQHGLLDSVPVTPGELDTLRQAGLLSPQATTGAGMSDLSLNPGSVGGIGSSDNGLLNPSDLTGQQTPRTFFPTPVDGLDVSTPDPHALAAGTGVQVGNIGQPMARALPGAGGGFGTAGVTLPGSQPLVTGDSSILGRDGTSGLNGSGGANGSAMSGGMPFMPMGGMGGLGGGGQGQQPKERQRNTWLTEDEDVWGTEPECAPAVVGRGDGPADGEPDRPASPVLVPPTPDRRTRRGR